MSSNLSLVWIRIRRAIRLDSTVFKEIRMDSNRLKSSLDAIILIFFLTSIYGLIVEHVSPEGPDVIGTQFVAQLIALLSDPIIIVAEWITFSCGVFFFTKIFKGQASLRSLLACLAYSKTPYIFSILRVIPIIGLLLGVVTVSWTITCDIIAVRESTNLSTGEATSVYILLSVLAILLFFSVAQFSSTG